MCCKPVLVFRETWKSEHCTLGYREIKDMMDIYFPVLKQKYAKLELSKRECLKNTFKGSVQKKIIYILGS